MQIYKKHSRRVKRKPEKTKERRERHWNIKIKTTCLVINKCKLLYPVIFICIFIVTSFQPFPTNQLFDSSLNPYGQQQQQQYNQQQFGQQQFGQQQFSQQQAQQQWPQSTGLTGLSFAEPIQQQQTFSNPYQQQSGGFNNFSLQAQMTGMAPQVQSMPFQTQMTGMPLQAQMTGMPPPQQQPFQTQQFTGAANNPFGQTNTPTQQQNGMFGTPSSVNPQVRKFSCITIWLVHLYFLPVLGYWYADNITWYKSI